MFEASDGVHGLEPWVTDGTDPGTRMIFDVIRPLNPEILRRLLGRSPSPLQVGAFSSPPPVQVSWGINGPPTARRPALCGWRTFREEAPDMTLSALGANRCVSVLFYPLWLRIHVGPCGGAMELRLEQVAIGLF